MHLYAEIFILLGNWSWVYGTFPIATLNQAKVTLCIKHEVTWCHQGQPRASAATAFSCINRAPAEASPVLHPLEQERSTPAPLFPGLSVITFPLGGSQGTKTPLISIAASMVRGRKACSQVSPRSRRYCTPALHSLLKSCLGIWNVSSSFFISLKYQNSLIACCSQSTASNRSSFCQQTEF